jgi:Spy/CpxP family protein refolding chaperone
MKHLLVFLLLPLSLATAADAPRKSDPFAGLLAAPDQLVKAREPLGLTDDQQKRLRELYTENEPAHRAKSAAIGEAQRALRAALEKQPVDEEDSMIRFAALLDAERAVKELEFRVLVAARAVLTAEQVAKMRALPSRAPAPASSSSREDALKAKLERLQQIIKARESAGKPPREHEQAIRELERAVREMDVEKAEPLVNNLLRALGEPPAGARVQ